MAETIVTLGIGASPADITPFVLSGLTAAPITNSPSTPSRGIVAPLALHVTLGPDGAPYLDLTHRARGVRFTTNGKGCETAVGTVPAPLAEAMRNYARPGLLWLQIDAGGDVVWAGRIEDVRFAADGWTFGAFGPRRALSDLPVTTLWSSTEVADWERVSDEESAGYLPSAFGIDTNNRLYIAPKLKEVFNDAVVGALSFETYHGGTQALARITAAYDVRLPAGWLARLVSCDHDLSGQAVEWTLSGDGAVQTGTIDETIAGQNRLLLQVYRNASALAAPIPPLRYVTGTSIVMSSQLADHDEAEWTFGIVSSPSFGGIFHGFTITAVEGNSYDNDTKAGKYFTLAAPPQRITFHFRLDTGIADTASRWVARLVGFADLFTDDPVELWRATGQAAGLAYESSRTGAKDPARIGTADAAPVSVDVSDELTRFVFEVYYDDDVATRYPQQIAPEQTDAVEADHGVAVPLTHGNINAASVVVTSFDEATTYTLTTDYTIDATAGAITADAGGAIGDGDYIKVTYTHNNHQVTAEILLANHGTAVALDNTVIRSREVDAGTAQALHLSGTAAAGAVDSITLAAGADATDGIYRGVTIDITGGTGSGQSREISSYDGTTKVAKVSEDWDTAPDATSTYQLRAIKLAAGAAGIAGFYNGLAITLDGGTGSGQVNRITAYDETTKVAAVAAAWATVPDGTTTYDIDNIYLTVKDPLGRHTYQYATDYTVNVATGEITALAAGSIPDDTIVLVDYTYIATRYQDVNGDTTLTVYDITAYDAIEDGYYYAKLTDVRARTSAGIITADGIVEDLLGQVVGLNAGQLRDVTALIDAPGVDIMDAGYEDETPVAVIDELADEGDEDGYVYEAQVWADRVLRFQRAGTNGRTWYADILSIDMDRTLDTLANSAYATYKDEFGRTRRTAVAADAGSVTQYGLTRRDYVRSKTTGQSESEGARDNYLDEAADVTPRAGVVIGRLTNGYGYGIAPYMLRGGDVLVVRNLPAQTPQSVADRVRAMRVVRTGYDTETGQVDAALEIELPDTTMMIVEAVVLAQQALEATQG